MELTYPDYFNDFKCIAGECPDTCCAGWKIEIDEKSLKKYKELETGFGNRLHNSIDPSDNTFLQYDEGCAFLNEDNLCDIYSEAGEDYFCETCRLFPRHMEDYEGREEWSLTLGCPVVARMLMQREAAVEFETTEVEKEQEEFEFFDYFLDTKLQESKAVLLEIAKNRELPIENRIHCVLSLAAQLQGAISNKELFTIDDILDKWTSMEREDLENVEYLELFATEIFPVLERLEHLNPKWMDMVKKARKILEDSARCDEAERAAMTYFSDIQKEQLLVYYLYGYVGGAVYDDDLLTKVYFGIFGIRAMELIGGGLMVANDETKFTKEKKAKLVWMYSKEIEHSDENLEMLDEYLVEFGEEE